MLLGCAKFVDIKGFLKPGSIQANQIVFEKKSEHMGKLVHECTASLYVHYYAVSILRLMVS
jgi:hypothetical protein